MGNTSSGGPAAGLNYRLGWRELAARIVSRVGLGVRAPARPADNHGGRVRRDERHGRSVAPRVRRAVALARRGAAGRPRLSPPPRPRSCSAASASPSQSMARRMRRSGSFHSNVLPRILAAAEWDLLRLRARATHQGDQSLHPRRFITGARFSRPASCPRTWCSRTRCSGRK